MSDTGKFRIFLSHINEEKALALVVKRQLEQAFSDILTVFVSSEATDNPGGEEWLERLRRELTDPQTRMLISLLSPRSLPRHWISVELGAAWGRKLGVFPLGHSGTAVPGTLPEPLKAFGGASVEQADVSKRLIHAVAQAIKMPVPLITDAVHNQNQSELKLVAATTALTALAAVVDAPAAPPKGPPTAPAILTADQETVLRVLQSAFNGGFGSSKTRLTDSDGARLVSMAPSDWRVVVRELQSMGFVGNTLAAGSGYSWHIKDEGLKWIRDAKLAEAEAAAVAAASPVEPPADPLDVTLDNEEIKILKLLAKYVDSGSGMRDGLTLEQGAAQLFIKPTIYRLHMETLVKHGLVDQELILGDANRFCITNDGLRWLKRGDLL